MKEIGDEEDEDVHEGHDLLDLLVVILLQNLFLQFLDLLGGSFDELVFLLIAQQLELLLETGVGVVRSLLQVRVEEVQIEHRGWVALQDHLHGGWDLFHVFIGLSGEGQ